MLRLHGPNDASVGSEIIGDRVSYREVMREPQRARIAVIVRNGLLPAYLLCSTLSQIEEQPQVITDRDIWRTARAVIEQHCDGAAIHAAQRADALLAEGDFEGYRVWRRVLAAITAIRLPKPTDRERVN